VTPRYARVTYTAGTRTREASAARRLRSNRILGHQEIPPDRSGLQPGFPERDFGTAPPDSLPQDGGKTSSGASTHFAARLSRLVGLPSKRKNGM